MKKITIPEQIIKKYRIKLLVLFGSTGTDFEREDSDLDLGYLTGEGLAVDKQLALLHDLTTFYRCSGIDLVNLRQATPGLKLAIAHNGRVLFGTEEDFLDFQLYAARVFADTKYLRLARELCLEERVGIMNAAMNNALIGNISD